MEEESANPNGWTSALVPQQENHLMIKTITRLAPVVTILFAAVLCMPVASDPPVLSVQGADSAQSVDLFDYVRVKRSPKMDIEG